MASVAGDILLRFNADTAGLDKGTAKIRNFEKTTTSSNKAVAASSRTAQNAIRALGTALAGLVSIQAGRSLLNTASSIRQIRIQIMSATTSVQQYNRVMGRLESLSLRTGSSLESTASTFQTFKLSADSLGLSVDDINNVIETFNDVAIATGASSFQLESALRQLGDAASAGELRWQDFRIVLQNFPALAGAIADSMGLTISELRDAVASGQDMGEVFRSVLQDQDKWKRAANEAPVTWERAINKVGVAWALLIGKIDEAFGIQDRLVAGLDEATKRLGEVDAESVGQDTADALRPLLEALDDLGASFFGSAASLIGLVGILKLLGKIIPKNTAGILSLKDSVGGLSAFVKNFFGQWRLLLFGLQKSQTFFYSLGTLYSGIMALLSGVLRVVFSFGKLIGLLSPLGIAIVLVTAFVRAFGEQLAGITNKAELFGLIMKGVNTILFVVIETIELLINVLGDVMVAVLNVGKVFGGVALDIVEFFTEWDAGFDKTLKAVEDLKGGFFKLSRDGIKEATKSFKEMWDIAEYDAIKNFNPPKQIIPDAEGRFSNRVSFPLQPLSLPDLTPRKKDISKKDSGLTALDEWKQGLKDQARLLEHELSHQFDIRKHWGEKTLELVKGFDILGINATSIKNSMELSALEEHQENLLNRRKNHNLEVEKAHRELAEAEAKTGKERSEEEIKRLARELEIKKQMHEQSEEAIAETKESILGLQLKSGKDGLDAFNEVLQGAGEKSKEFFMLRKGAALAQGALDAASAISAAYSWGSTWGPAGGAAAAAVAATASALHLSAIADTSYKSFRAGGPAMAGEMYRVGEGGPEMFRAGGKQFMIPGESGQVIPNHNLPSGGGGNTIINIKNYTSGRVSARETETSNGKEIEVIVKEVEKRMAAGVRRGGSPLANSLQSSFGLNRAAGGF